MASLMEELISVLQEETKIYEDLLVVSDEKTAVIVKNDIGKLQEIVDKEQETIDVITALERKREEIVRSIAMVVNRKPDTLTVAEIIRMLDKQPQEQKELAAVHKQIRSVVERLQQMNHHNRELLERSLEMTEFNINLLQSMNQAPETANYNMGAYSGSQMGASQSMFDTKQ